MPDDSDPSRPDTMTGPAYAGRTIALVGLMGAGKSTVGRRLAEKLGRDFYDSDAEIEKAAGLTISDIFALHGEADLRRGEKQVLKRLLDLPPHVLDLYAYLWARADGALGSGRPAASGSRARS